MKNAQRFLADGNKVKVTIMFRGREMTHPELGGEVLERFAKEQSIEFAKKQQSVTYLVLSLIHI